MSSDGTESDFYAIQCSNCLAKLKVRNAPTPGKKIICPKCKESFIVGEQEALPSKPAPKKQAPPPIEDEEEEQKESPKPKKKKKKQSGSRSGLAIGLSVGGLILLGALGYGVYFLISNGFLGSKHESVIKSLISNLEEMASVLESVQDESSAQAAAPRITTISGKLVEQQKAMKEMKVAKVEDERLKKKYEEKLRAVTARLRTAGMNAGFKGAKDPSFRDAIKKMQQLRY
ncbi:hypothetical protein EBX93_08615 [bacterium]|nr:hypothetical protein [bacterium]